MFGHDLGANTENSKMSQRRTMEVNNAMGADGGRGGKSELKPKAFQSIVKGAQKKIHILRRRGKKEAQ